MAALEAYFDESARDAGVFSVAGYLFDARAARGYSVEARRQFGPYGGFHMTDLLARQEGYSGITKTRRDELVKAAVDLANRYVMAGVTVSCWTQDVLNPEG